MTDEISRTITLLSRADRAMLNYHRLELFFATMLFGTVLAVALGFSAWFFVVIARAWLKIRYRNPTT